MADTYKLFAPSGNPRCVQIELIAELLNVKLEVVQVKYEELENKEYSAKNPFQKVPVLETKEGHIFESNAIIRYLARLNLASGLYGSTPYQHSQVDQWLDFITNEIESLMQVAVMQTLGYHPPHEESFTTALNGSKDKLKLLENHLKSHKNLIGDQLTVADIVLAVRINAFYTYVLGEKIRKGYPVLLNWFTVITESPHWKNHFGRTRLCKTAFALPKHVEQKQEQPEKKEKTVQPAAAAEKKQQQPKQEKPKQEKPKQEKPKAEKPKEDKDEEEMPKKKVNALDLLPASPFNLDDYKRAFFLEKDIAKNMENLFQQIDAQGWSLWELKYNKTENQGKQLIQTCNLNKISLMQKIDPNFKKYSFAIQGVYGQEPNLEIMGAWLWRGVEIPAEIKDLDSFEYLTLTKVDLTDPAAKQQWAEYWINQNEDEQSVKGLLARNLMYYR